MKRIFFHYPVLWPSMVTEHLTSSATEEGPWIKIVVGRVTHRVPIVAVKEMITVDESDDASATKPAIKTRKEKKLPHGMGRAKEAIAAARAQRGRA